MMYVREISESGYRWASLTQNRQFGAPGVATSGVFTVQRLLHHTVDHLETVELQGPHGQHELQPLRSPISPWPAGQSGDLAASRDGPSLNWAQSARDDATAQLRTAQILASRVPDLLQTTTLGGWVGFHEAKTAKKLVTLGIILSAPVLSFVDLGLDLANAHEWAHNCEGWFTVVSCTCIVLGLCVTCLFDATITRRGSLLGAAAIMTDVEETTCVDINADVSRRTSNGVSTERSDEYLMHSGVALRAPSFCVRCAMNLTFTRVLYESRVALRAWRHGRLPNAAFYFTKQVDGIFEAMPQSLIYTYSVVRSYFELEEDLSHYTMRIKVVSLVLSVCSAAMTFATLGQVAQPLWRLCFFLFCGLQIMLRSATLAAFVLLLRDHCTYDVVSYCSEDSYHYYVIAYAFFTMITSMLCHVVHLCVHQILIINIHNYQLHCVGSVLCVCSSLISICHGVLVCSVKGTSVAPCGVALPTGSAVAMGRTDSAAAAVAVVSACRLAAQLTKTRARSTDKNAPAQVYDHCSSGLGASLSSTATSSVHGHWGSSTSWSRSKRLPSPCSRTRNRAVRCCGLLTFVIVYGFSSNSAAAMMSVQRHAWSFSCFGWRRSR